MRFLFVALLIPFAVLATEKPSQTPSQNQNQSQAQHQSQLQAQDAQAAASLQFSYQERLQIPFTPAPTAPSIYASGPCNTGNSKAVTLPIIGLSRGESTADSECNFRELVRITTPLSPGLALLMICSRPDVQSLPDYQLHCKPQPPAESVTKADLEQLRQENIQRVDTAFRKSQSK